MSKRSCDRRGVVYLKDPEGRWCGLPVTCKTWGCSACQKARLARCGLMIERGLAEIGESVLISITYVAPGPLSEPTVSSVRADVWRRDWAALLKVFSRLFGLSAGKLQWFRVMELTKRRQVHAHLILGLPTWWSGPIACEEKASYDEDWRQSDCECLEHMLSRAWHRITSDSWVVDVRRVYAPHGAAAYLCKYLRKGFRGWVREGLEALGYVRRFARSRSWPFGRVYLRGTGPIGGSPLRVPESTSRWLGHGFRSGEIEPETWFSENWKESEWCRLDGDPWLLARYESLRRRHDKFEFEALFEGDGSGGG